MSACTKGCVALVGFCDCDLIVSQQDSGRDPVEVARQSSCTEAQAGLNGPSGSPTSRPEPDFATCGRCGEPAYAVCSWDPADGWCCSACGGCDSDE